MGASTLIACLSTFVITLVVLVLLLAYVPHFENIYTWIRKPKDAGTCLGLNVKTTPSSAVGKLVKATTDLAKSVVELVCPMKTELQAVITTWSLSVGPSGTECNAQADAAKNGVRETLHSKVTSGYLSAASANEVLAKFDTLMDVLVEVVCTSDTLQAKDVAQVANEFLDAIC